MLNCEEAIAKGLCNKAECCGIIPFPNKLYDRFAHFTDVKYELTTLTEYVFAIADDSYCIFKDRVTHKCLIYEYRPDVCIKYGTIDKLPCPVFDSEGNYRSRAERKRLRVVITKDVDSKINQITKLKG